VLYLVSFIAGFAVVEYRRPPVCNRRWWAYKSPARGYGCALDRVENAVIDGLVDGGGRR
jgi:hypothetical protein